MAQPARPPKNAGTNPIQAGPLAGVQKDEDDDCDSNGGRGDPAPPIHRLMRQGSEFPLNYGQEAHGLPEFEVGDDKPSSTLEERHTTQRALP